MSPEEISFDDGPLFSPEEIELHGLGDVEGARPNNLTYPIHPMLIRDRWVTPLPSISLQRTLVPILRLASAILDTEACFKLWYTIINAEPVIDEDQSEKAGETITTIQTINIYSSVNPSPAELREEFRRTVVHISHFLQIGLFDPNDPSLADVQRASHVDGFTQYEVDQKICMRTSHRPRIEGIGSKMSISTRTLSEISRLESLEPKTPAIINKILRLQFSVANTIGHELTHVVAAATRLAAVEPYYNDQSLNELGHAFEMEVFGGIELKDDNNPLLGHSKWPTTFSRPNDAYLVWARRPPKGSSTCYIIPGYYVCQLGQQAFWDLWRNVRNDKLLHIPRVLGMRFRGLGEVDPTWRESQSSEGKWSADSDGVVRRYQSFNPEPSDFIRDPPSTDWRSSTLRTPSFWNQPLPPIPTVDASISAGQPETESGHHEPSTPFDVTRISAQRRPSRPRQWRPSSAVPAPTLPSEISNTDQPYSIRFDTLNLDQPNPRISRDGAPYLLPRTSPLPSELPSYGAQRRPTLDGATGSDTHQRGDRTSNALPQTLPFPFRVTSAGVTRRSNRNRRTNSPFTWPSWTPYPPSPLRLLRSRTRHGASSRQQTPGTRPQLPGGPSLQRPAPQPTTGMDRPSSTTQGAPSVKRATFEPLSDGDGEEAVASRDLADLAEQQEANSMVEDAEEDGYFSYN